jgi:hypothetical protein
MRAELADDLVQLGRPIAANERAGLLLPGPADGHRDDAADRQPPVPC